MDILDEDLISFWRELNLNEVEYIMIGGFAAILHGTTRITQDVDIWIKDTLENRIRLRKSLANLEVGDYKELETMQFVPGWTSIYITGGIELDIYTDLKAYQQKDFEDCYNNSFIAEIEDVKVRFLHINNLLEEKKTVARPKDLQDLEELQKIIAIKKEME